MAKYSHTTLADFRIAIAKNLGDDGMIFWSSAEIDQAVEEALLTFGAISGFWKDKIFVKTEFLKTIYNIFMDVDNISLIEPSIEFGILIDWLNTDLIENLSNADPDSDHLTRDELFKLIIAKYNTYQLQTNLVLTNKEDIEVPPQQNEINLGNNILDIIRIVFVDDTEQDSPEYVLEVADEGEIYQFNSEILVEEGIPQFYSTVYGSPNLLKLYPIPIRHGKLKVISINGHEGAVNEDAITNLPNNLVPYIKYGVEEEIFSKDGVFKDPGRAAYCKSRWEEGILIGRNYSSILIAEADGIAIGTDSLGMLDIYADYAYSKLYPEILGLAGFNIFGLDRIPDVEVHSLGLTSIINAPIPTNDGDFIDLAQEYIDPLRNYVVHILQMKCGIAELQKSIESRNNLIKLGVEHNIKLKQKGISYDTIFGKTKLEEKAQERLVEQE